MELKSVFRLYSFAGIFSAAGMYAAALAGQQLAEYDPYASQTASDNANVVAGTTSKTSSPAPEVLQQKGPFFQFTNKNFIPNGVRPYCIHNPQECRPERGEKYVRMTDELMATLANINMTVNMLVEYTKDIDNPDYKSEEVWSIPVPHEGQPLRGDCEDFALLKRKLLKEYVPEAAMSLVFARTVPNDEGHGVLAVRTDKGDFILDNNSEEVKLPQDTPYKYISIMDPDNPWIWHEVRMAQSSEFAPVQIANINEPRPSF